MTHPTWELPLPDTEAGLVLTPCPGTKDASLSDSIAELKKQGVMAIVTALSLEEMQDRGVASLPEEVEQAGLKWFHLPIEDDCAPGADFIAKWQQASPELHQTIKKGQKIALHCMGGSGRTGLLAAHLLLEREWPLEQIISEVQALRPGAFTKQVQVQYIQQFANQ
ncbi:cyclin-dependent kinase inhibitor 3 family protein [Marinomonas pollencensis]|uniref:Protein-tyrosine phosphatase n=1 Tax=Marinomonas pollencensis TaxID=491954 RepID=A0A3E0D4V9_9GAMM|nr:cyclin-dependent kinase inhibitor 3 family protein [Marinomonas pollencensis]REG77584.1 protein-tyrosine phosphatase [Marinomonas pollencensis]